MGQLDGKVAVITGASRGLGKTIADLFEREGAEVIGWHRDHPGDMVNPDFINMITDRYSFEFDILVNNAAIQGPSAPLAEADNIPEEWEKTIRVNLLTPVALCRLCLFHMQTKTRGHGKIINLSGGGAINPRPNYTAYAASKAALVAFSATLAAEYPGVDINCVSPGDLGPMDSDHAGKEAELSAAAGLCLYLASRQSDGVTGRLLSAKWDGWQEAEHFTKWIKSDPSLYTLTRIVMREY